MRTPPEDEYDLKDVEELNPRPWMLDLLDLNPSYTSWGPHEDYMWTKEGAKDWDSRVICPSWSEFGPWDLDELNECVHFYFSIQRDTKQCETCGGIGYHPDAQWISESFYSHSSPFKHQNLREQQACAVMAQFQGGDSPRAVHRFGSYPSQEILEKYGPEFRKFCEEMREHGCWNERTTNDEHKALEDAGRSTDPQFGHDAINRCYLIEQRCKRLGVPKSCPDCAGSGRVYIEPAAHVNLTLWWLHPRKGCSRGIEIQRIKQNELPEIFAFLREARDRNAERFAKIPNPEPVES